MGPLAVLLSVLLAVNSRYFILAVFTAPLYLLSINKIKFTLLLIVVFAIVEHIHNTHAPHLTGDTDGFVLFILSTCYLAYFINDNFIYNNKTNIIEFK